MPIKSMTGFASVGRETPAEVVDVTVKSVNHRFLDVVIRAPASLVSLEVRLRAMVQERLARGRVELTVAGEVTGRTDREVILDEDLVERVVAAVGNAGQRGLVAGGVTVSDLLRIPGALEIRASERPDEPGAPAGLIALVEAVVGEALDALVAMRDTEGRFLGADLEKRLVTIAGFVDRIEVEAGEGQQRLEARLRERVEALPPDLQGDGAALAREIVRFVARSDIDEEVVRLRSHLGHWRELSTSAEPCGRRLDFLIQEMNREVNTIGSKVESAGATELVIAAKAELERIREQVQNVE